MISAVSKRVDIIAQGKAQLERLEAMRKLFTKSRALSLAQRALLYAKDELEMCTMRMRVSLSSNFEGACGQWHSSSLAKFVLSWQFKSSSQSCLSMPLTMPMISELASKGPTLSASAAKVPYGEGERQRSTLQTFCCRGACEAAGRQICCNHSIGHDEVTSRKAGRFLNA